MKNTLVTIAGCLWVVFFAVLTVYEFPAPRAWVLETLALKEGNDAHSQLALASLLKQPAAVAYGGTPLSLNIAPIDAAINASSTITYDPYPLYEFKLVENVDPCTLNKLGAQGWNPTQFGGNIVSTGGFDANCATRGTYDGFDWALFVRPHVPSSGN